MLVLLPIYSSHDLLLSFLFFLFFFFNDPATTEIYTLSLHDALPILPDDLVARARAVIRRTHGSAGELVPRLRIGDLEIEDRKSTRLNSSHVSISYAVFCLKKKKKRKFDIL